MRLVFCFSRSCRPYPTILALRSFPCCPGAKLRFSRGHLSLKHLLPFRNSLMPPDGTGGILHRYNEPSCFSFLDDRFTGLASPFVPDGKSFVGRWSPVVGRKPQIPTESCWQAVLLHPAAFWRTAAVVRNRRKVFDGTDFDPGGSQRANRRFASRPRPADPHVDRADAVVARHVGRVHRRLLRGEGSALPRPAEAERTGTFPGNHVAGHVGDGHDRIVERGLHVHQSMRDVLALLLLERLFLALFVGSGGAARCCWLGHFCSQFSVLSSQFAPVHVLH